MDQRGLQATDAVAGARPDGTGAATTDADAERTRLFGEHRPLLLGVAYRLLGRVADAEDVVQEAWLRWAAVDPASVANPRAFLARVTTRLALDQLRRARARREEYVGPWLPEPLIVGPDATEWVERAESLSFGLLVVLETLSPLERAVFVLREGFELPYAEIAEILGRGVEAVRQLAVRARAHVQARRPRFPSDPAAQRRLTERFLAASAGGSLEALLDLLAPEATLVADGGGKARAPRLPVRGADAVARFLVSTARPEAVAGFLRSIGRRPEADARLALASVNGEAGIVVTADGAVVSVLVLEVADERVERILVVANPDKLAALTPAPLAP